jgi:hypothetical protein
MIEVRTQNFSLRLELNLPARKPCLGSYFIVLFGTKEGDGKKTFREEFLSDADMLPFYTLEDASTYAEVMAAFWKVHLVAYPKLTHTTIRELVEVWRRFSIALHPSNRGYDQKAVYTFN